MVSIWRMSLSERGDKNTVVLKKTLNFYLPWQVIEFSVIALCFRGLFLTPDIDRLNRLFGLLNLRLIMFAVRDH